MAALTDERSGRCGDVTEAVVPLIEKGVLNCRQKSLLPERSGPRTKRGRFSRPGARE